MPAGVRPDFILSAAESYEQADSFGDAISWYRELVTASGSASNDALALARIVAIKWDELNESYAVERDELIVSYPRTQQALDVLCDALERGETIAPTDRGLVYYRHNDYTEAEPHFREQIAVAPAALASAVAHYYLGALLESRQKDEEALTNYALVTNLNPTTFIAADSLWWQGRILEDQNRRDEAQALYARIVAQYSSSIWAADAAFRHGMLAYDAGQYLEANGLWATYQAAVLDPAERERLTLWQAKALLMAGQRDAAASLLEPLATAGEDDYYGIRALSLLTGAHGQPPATREQDVDLTPSFDWEEAEGWLSARTGRPVSDVGWSTDYRWLRAQELWRVGRTGMGDEEAFDLIDAHDQDPIATYTLARRLAEAGRVGMSAAPVSGCCVSSTPTRTRACRRRSSRCRTHRRSGRWRRSTRKRPASRLCFCWLSCGWRASLTRKPSPRRERSAWRRCCRARAKRSRRRSASTATSAATCCRPT